MDDPIIGVDLGTTNSVVAITDAKGDPLVLADDQGVKIQPSVVSFHPNGSVVVGSEAKQRRTIDPHNTVYSAKRLIGRTFNSREVAAAAARMPYTIREGVNQQPVIATRAGEFAIPEISAIVLDHMRTIAKTQLGVDVNRSVITVPANFTDAQRSATATAGAIAGLTVVRVLNEPTAAALAYGYAKRLHQQIAVYDFGGGTFDVTLLRLRDDVFEVLSTAGDSFLGGDDIDERLVDHMVQTFLKQTRTDLRADELAMQRLRAVAEQTKIELSRRTRAIVKVDEIAYGPGGAPLDLQLEISRDELIARSADIIDRTFPVCEEALRAASIKTSQIDDIVLVGGTTKMPHVRERVTQFFGKSPRSDVNPDEAVAAGAALQGAALRQLLAGKTRRSTARRAVPPPAPPMEARTRPPSHSEARPAAARTTAPRIADPAAAARPTIVPTEDAEEVTGVLDHSRRRRTTGSPPPIPGAASRRTDPQFATRRASSDSGVTVARITRPGGTQVTPTPPAPTRTRRPSSINPASAKTISPGDGIVAPPPVPRPHLRPDSGSLSTGVPRPIADSFDLESSLASLDAHDEVDLDRLAREAADSMDRPRDPLAGLDRPHVDPLGAAPLSADMFTEVEDAPEPTIPRSPPTPAAQAPARPAPVSPPHARTSFDFDALGPAAPAPPAPARAPVVLDVLSHALGVGTVRGYCDEILHRNARVPSEQTRVFTTSTDLQRTVRLRVYQGNSRRIAENTVLGDLVLDQLPARPRGQLAIEVTFHVDANGMLNVRARDRDTGTEQRANLDIAGAQSADEVAAARERFQSMRGS